MAEIYLLLNAICCNHYSLIRKGPVSLKMFVYILHLPWFLFFQVMNMYGDLVMDSVPERVRN